jgi:hypothetical protein
VPVHRNMPVNYGVYAHDNDRLLHERLAAPDRSRRTRPGAIGEQTMMIRYPDNLTNTNDRGWIEYCGVAQFSALPTAVNFAFTRVPVVVSAPMAARQL